MVRNSLLTRDIVVICTLLTMGGIVPCLRNLQKHLQLYIDVLCQQLKNQQVPYEEIDALRRLICLIVDTQLNCSFNNKGINWQDHKLSPCLYDTDTELVFLAPHLTALQQSQCPEIVLCVNQLSAISPVPLPGCPLPASTTIQRAFPAPQKAITPADTIASRATTVNNNRWRPLVMQLLLSVLFLSVIWSSCRYLLTGTF